MIKDQTLIKTQVKVFEVFHRMIKSRIGSNAIASTTSVWNSKSKSSYSWRLENRTSISWRWNFCHRVKTQQKEEKAGIKVENCWREESREEKSSD